MFYVYVLKSLKNGDIYIGYSNDLRQRFNAHNQKKVVSTKPYTSWRLVYYEAYKSKNDATKRELQLKMHKQKEDLKQQTSSSLA